MMMYDKQELIKMVQRVIDCEEDEDTIDELLEILELVFIAKKWYNRRYEKRISSNKLRK